MIAERVFALANSGDPVVARIFEPQSNAEGEWRCRIEIEGLGDVQELSVSGVDSLQALELALWLLFVKLERYEGVLSCFDGPVGDLGFPLVVHWNYGPSLRPLKEEVRQSVVDRISEALTKELMAGPNLPADDASLDELILASISTRWRKTARVISRVSFRCVQRRLETTPAEIAGRIKHLVENQSLEAQGSLSNWRHSEVRFSPNKPMHPHEGQVPTIDKRFAGDLVAGACLVAERVEGLRQLAKNLPREQVKIFENQADEIIGELMKGIIFPLRRECPHLEDEE